MYAHFSRVSVLGQVDYEEFTMVMDILRVREGFTKADYEEIVELYRNFDGDKSGSVETSELRVALQWLGFAFSEAETKAICRALVVELVDVIRLVPCDR